MNERFLLILYKAYCASRGMSWIEPTDDTVQGFTVWLKYQVERNLEPYEEAGLPKLREVLTE